MSDSQRALRHMLAKHARTQRNTIARGVLRLAGDGSKMQTGQIDLLEGEMLEGAERPESYGFTSHPHPGAEVFVGFLSADRSHGVILACGDRRYRVTASKPGEVSIYTDEGDRIDLQRDNNIKFTTKHLTINAEMDVVINTKNYQVNASAGIEYNTPSLAVGGAEGGTTESMLEGGMTASDDMWANGGAVSLRGHVHEGVQHGDDTTAKPVGG